MNMAKLKLNTEVTNAICQALRAGNTRHDSAVYGGICETTFYEWLKKADEGKEPYTEFSEAVKKAEADAIVRNVAIIQKAANDGTWQAAAWFLERRRPDDWGRDRNTNNNETDGIDKILEVTQ